MKVGLLAMEGDFKEVNFEKYCKTCKYIKNKEYEDPCYDCLGEPARIDSHKPVNYKEEK